MVINCYCIQLHGLGSCYNIYNCLNRLAGDDVREYCSVPNPLHTHTYTPPTHTHTQCVCVVWCNDKCVFIAFNSYHYLGWFIATISFTLSLHFLFPGKEYVGYQPKWFTKDKDPQTGNVIHKYTGEYWECKEKQDWSRCPDIFLWSLHFPMLIYFYIILPVYRLVMLGFYQRVFPDLSFLDY